jgi:hypothetical protein
VRYRGGSRSKAGKPSGIRWKAFVDGVDRYLRAAKKAWIVERAGF